MAHRTLNRLLRAVLGLTFGFAVVTVLTWWTLSLTWVSPVDIHLRWADDVTDARRVELERQFRLTDARRREPTTWQYQLADWSPEVIKAIVDHPQVVDTHHLDRAQYLAEFPPDRSRRILAYSVAVGLLIPAIVVAFRRSRSMRAEWWAEFAAAMTPGPGAIEPVSHRPRLTAAVGLGAVAVSACMTWFAGASFLRALGALLIVYAGGYLVGSLFIPQPRQISLAVIRTVAGILLTSAAFLLSLVLSIPWFIAPGLLVLVAAVVGRGHGFSWPHQAVTFRWDGFGAALLTAILLSPIAITYFAMAPGAFPPVFYNVDTAYSLEKVHALVRADRFPPPSLSNLDVTRTYHYGTQAAAALISRGSGLLPHHSLFLIVLPLLTAGVVAAAVAVARHVARPLPVSITVPLLLISVPSLSRSFWDRWWPQWVEAVTSHSVTLERILGSVDLWGILSNEAQNVGGDFLILGTVGGMAIAPVWGWTLAAFLIGVSVLFKTTGGIALVSGFALAEVWRGVAVRRFVPSPQLVLALSIFAATYGLFFVASFESPFRVELYAFEHMRTIIAGGNLTGLLLDVAWLSLPVIIVLSARTSVRDGRSAPLLLMAVAPIVVMNTTRLVHVGEGGEGAGLDWVQISHAVPFLVHAFAVSLAGQRWHLLGRARRVAFLVTIALAVAPVALAAGRYSAQLLRDPRSGHEFVDNRPLAEALATIPIDGSIIVTNDLRYPANEFARDDRQLQIPALFGHQAFAVNFSYEPVEDRREVQRLLQQPEWSGAIAVAARRHGWTHFVVRKDYVHPAPLPLERQFENDTYVVFRFP